MDRVYMYEVAALCLAASFFSQVRFCNFKPILLTNHKPEKMMIDINLLKIRQPIDIQRDILLKIGAEPIFQKVSTLNFKIEAFTKLCFSKTSLSGVFQNRVYSIA